MDKLTTSPPARSVISLDSARERAETARNARQVSRSLVENTALALSAAFALTLCGGIDLKPSLRRLPERIYSALRDLLPHLAGENHPNAMLPELFDAQLDCCREQDHERRAFDWFVERNYDGDPAAALRMVARLRVIEPRAGLPEGADPRRWTMIERARALMWLRCLERLHDAVEVV